MTEPACPACGAEMVFKGKDTFSGDEIREYLCPKCGRFEDIRGGKALWQILEEDRESREEPPSKP